MTDLGLVGALSQCALNGLLTILSPTRSKYNEYNIQTIYGL